MSRPWRSFPPVHFHIRWSLAGLDWQPFDSREEAVESAQAMVQPGETYSIEEFEDSCEKCAGLLAEVAKGSGTK